MGYNDSTQIIRMVEGMDAEGLLLAAQAIRRRYAELFPDYEVVYLALPKSPEHGKGDIQAIIDFLDRHKNSPSLEEE